MMMLQHHYPALDQWHVVKMNSLRCTNHIELREKADANPDEDVHDRIKFIVWHTHQREVTAHSTLAHTKARVALLSVFDPPLILIIFVGTLLLTGQLMYTRSA